MMMTITTITITDVPTRLVVPADAMHHVCLQLQCHRQVKYVVITHPSVHPERELAARRAFHLLGFWLARRGGTLAV